MLERCATWTRTAAGSIELADVKLLAHPRPVKNVFCVGWNYPSISTRAREAAGRPQLPKHPVFFSKASTAMNGRTTTSHGARISTQMDWEVELGMVIGTTGKFPERCHGPRLRLRGDQRRVVARPAASPRRAVAQGRASTDMPHGYVDVTAIRSTPATCGSPAA